MQIPEVINGYNVYDNGNKIVGITGSITLPTLSALTETIKGAGILGEYETSCIGHFGSTEIKIPFQMVAKEMVTAENITIRASQQMKNPSTGGVSQVGMRIVMRGAVKEFDFGTIENGKAMGASQTKEVTYLLVEQDGVSLLELDKLNYVYKLNGVDQLEKVRSLI